MASSDLVVVVSWRNVVESGKTSSELGMAAYGSLSSIQKSLPTKIVAQCQHNRSQHRNKIECMDMLRAKLYEVQIRNIKSKNDEQNNK